MAFNVFISYSTKDLPLVERVRTLLQDSSVKVFVAEHSVEPGESLRDKILAAIEVCDLFLLLWSRNSDESRWVQQEVGVATSSGKTILPILLDGDLAMPGLLGDTKYLRAHGEPEKALAWLRQNVFARAHKKQQSEGLAWLGLGAAILYLLSRE